MGTHIEKNTKEKTIINSFFAIRFLFFTFIFIHHTKGLVRIPIIDQSGLAVSGFLIMSGFLCGYLYLNKYEKIKIKDIFDFVTKRFKKIYLLHVLTLFLSLGLFNYFNITTMTGLFDLLKKFFMNLVLLQSWVNNMDYYYSFNGVTWFLSTYLFLTLLTIPLLRGLTFINKKKHSNIYCILLIILLLISHMVWSYFIVTNNHSERFWLYVFPPSRIFEYAIGILLGNLVVKFNHKFKNEKIIFTILEVLSIVIVCIFVKFVPDTKFLTYWSSKWVIPLIFFISIFGFQKGYISQFISLKPFIKLGSASMVMFIIHQVVVTYVLFINRNPAHRRLMALYMYVTTIILSLLIERLKNKKKDNK